MPRATNDGIELEYDTFGDSQHPPVLLVMGLGGQMTAWDDDFCRLLADRRFFVARYDNRDVGLSTKLEDSGPPDVLAAITARLEGKVATGAPYLLADMADDGFAVLDALGLERSHVVGVSMGGMIAQAMAISRPERVLTLTSIMSTTGAPDVGEATPDAIALLLRAPATDKEDYVTTTVAAERFLNGPSLPFDEARAAERAAARFDRSYYPVGVGRQLVAVLASGDRTQALANVDVPTLVVHGDADPLVGHSGGVATAKAVPGAELLTIPEMGHNLPPEKWEEIVDAIVEHTGKVED